MAKVKPSSETTNAESSESPTFEDQLVALNGIVEKLEEGELGLDDTLAEYRRGVGLLKSCHALLADAERRIELLTAVDEDGMPDSEPFDDAQSADLADKADQRSRRRTAKKKGSAD